ncbi:hypothetical protein ACU4GH_18695 [Bradyrhizobium betae]
MSAQEPEARAEFHALARLAFAADHLADQLELLRHALVGGDDFIESVGDLAVDAEIVAAHPHGESRRSASLARRAAIRPGIRIRHTVGFWLWDATTGA